MMRTLALLVHMACGATFSKTSGMVTTFTNTSAQPKLAFTRLQRFDAEAWTKQNLRPLKIQSSALAKMPGTFVSHRQMLALLGGRSEVNTTEHSIKRMRGFGNSGDVDGFRPREIIRLEDLSGAEYAGEIEVGTRDGAPLARLRVIFDTGSTDLWILSDMCQRAPCTYEGHHSFDHKSSETFSSPKNPVELSTSYGSGDLYGLLGFDTVRLGPLTVEKQTMGLISKELGQSFETLAFDGLMGLGFPALGFQSQDALPFLDGLMQQGSLPIPCFAFYLHRDPSRGGAVLWGGADTRLYQAPLRWFPVIEEAYWSLDIVSFRVGGQRFNFDEVKRVKNQGFIQRRKPLVQKPRLVVDSGTTLFTVPSFLLPALYKEIGDGMKQCSELEVIPPLVFGIRDDAGAEREIIVSAAEYMVRNVAFDGMCIPSVVKMDMDFGEKPIMILGEVFMRHYFTVFKRGHAGEKSSVGLARSKEDSEAESFFTETHVANQNQ